MGEIIYKPLIDDMTWSYSRLSSYESCPYMWKLTYLDDVPKTEMFYTEYGSLMHKILANFLTGKNDEGFLKTQFVSEFVDLKNKLHYGNMKGNPGTKVANKYFDTGLEFFCSSLENFKNEISGCDIKAVEKRSYFKIGKYKFVGVKDLVLEKDGRLIIVDHKSHDLKPRNGKKNTAANKELDKYLRQLYLYSQTEDGKRPAELWFNCFRTGTVIKEEFKSEKFKEVCDWAIETINTISNDTDFDENYNYFFCNYICDKHESCWLWREEKGVTE